MGQRGGAGAQSYDQENGDGGECQLADTLASGGQCVRDGRRHWRHNGDGAQPGDGEGSKPQVGRWLLSGRCGAWDTSQRVERGEVKVKGFQILFSNQFWWMRSLTYVDNLINLVVMVLYMVGHSMPARGCAITYADRFRGCGLQTRVREPMRLMFT